MLGYLCPAATPEGKRTGLINQRAVGSSVSRQRFDAVPTLLDIIDELLCTAAPACGAVYLHVIDYNDRAIAFYERLGFVPLRREKGFYTIKAKDYDSLVYVLYVNGGKPPAQCASTTPGCDVL